MKAIIKSNLPFERLTLSKEEALDMFQHNRFKIDLIGRKVQSRTSVYKIGDFIDLCVGPHLPSTGMVKSIKVMKHSAAYWLGDAKEESLQRVYGISFSSKDEMKEHLKLIEEAAKRDHRVIGQQ